MKPLVSPDGRQPPLVTSKLDSACFAVTGTRKLFLRRNVGSLAFTTSNGSSVRIPLRSAIRKNRTRDCGTPNSDKSQSWK